MIRARAKELWEINGRPAGRDLEFWLQAERDYKKQKSERLIRLIVRHRSVRMYGLRSETNRRSGSAAKVRAASFRTWLFGGA
jgi:predicted thioredoxin/glutaredoxin